MDGVVRPPSEFSMTLALFPSITATQELVVPRSMPIAFAMIRLLLSGGCFQWLRITSPPSNDTSTAMQLNSVVAPECPMSAGRAIPQPLRAQAACLTSLGSLTSIFFGSDLAGFG